MVRTGAVAAVAGLGLALSGLAFTSGLGLADRAAAQPAAAAPAVGDPVAGKMVFANASCGSCHTLKDSGAMGPVGPSLDGDTNLSTSFIVSRVTNGQGSMPPFNDQLSPQEIADVAAYLMKAAAK